WLKHAAGDTALDANDFSATTDLYAVAANVYSMGIVPVSLVNLGALAVAATLPFLPVVVIAMSPQVVIERLTGILLCISPSPHPPQPSQARPIISHGCGRGSP